MRPTRKIDAPIIFSILLVGLSLVSLSPPAQATLVSNNDLFLSPAEVGAGIFPTQELTTGTSFEYTSADVGGDLLGVKILPLLKPNPFNAQGVYTSADLANITVSNYASFFAVQPGVDYSADLASSGAVVSYGAAGTYFVEIIAQNSGGQFTKIFKDLVDDFAGDDLALGVVEDPPQRTIASPNAQLLLVSNDTVNGYSPAALATLRAEGKNVVSVSTLAEAIAAIRAESTRVGRRISVVLVGHGTPGTIRIGTQFIANADITLPGNPVRMTPKQFQTQIDQFADTISFYSCCTGRGPAGDAFVSDFISSLNSVGYFKNVTSAISPGFNFGIVGYQNVTLRGRVVTVPIYGLAVTRPGFFDLDATAACTTVGSNAGCGAVPQPASLILLGLGTLGLLAYAWRRANRVP
jgi:hypothetical protein